MAVKTVRVCDVDGCKQPAIGYRVYRDGDREALGLDLCDEHAAPIVALLEAAKPMPFPAKPRVTMTPTRLRTTPETKPLKK